MHKDSYTRLKEALNKKRKALLAKKFESAEIEIMPRLPNLNQNVLSNLPNHFKNATTEIKMEVICSIFSQKLVFDTGKFRTIELNSVIALLTNNNNGFLMEGKKKSLLISDFSSKVHPGGFEPPTC